MKKKILGLIGLSILAFLVFVGFASANITFSSPSPATLPQISSSFTINATSDVNETVNFTTNTITDYNSKKIIIDSISPVPFNASEPRTITINYTIESGFDFFGKKYEIILTAKNSSTDAEVGTTNIPFAQTPFCAWDGNSANETGDLEVQIRDISVVEGFGDDTEWYPLDEIEVEVRVENKNNDFDIDNIVVEWGLFNKETGEWTIEVDEEKDFSLKDGDEKTLILNFKLEDLDEDFEDLENGDFIFYVRATGEVDDDAGAYDTCASDATDSNEVKIIIESDFVILDDIQFPETTSCGSEVQITANIWNIGDEDQDEVYVVIYNQELGINEKVVIGDIDAFEDEKLDTLIKIPQDTEEKYYTLTFYVYNEDNEVYENDNDDEAKFSLPLKIEGNCIFDPKLTITASLISGGKAGEELVVKAVLKNTDSKTRTFSIEAGNYNSWAELVGLEPISLTLNAGESKEVLLTFNVNRDVSGEQTFNILVSSDNKLIATQPTSVSIEKSGFDLTGITGAVISKENWYLWGIGALNIILVIIIIVVAVRLARKK